MSSGNTRQITWPRLCHPFRSDDFCIRPYYNQFSICPKISSASISRQTASSSGYLLMQPSLFLSQSEGLHHNSPKTITGGPLVKFGETIAKKFTRMGLRLVISILATDTTCKIY